MSAKTRDLNGVNSYFHKHVCEICDGAHWLNQTGVGEKTQFSGHWTDEPGNIWIFKGTSNVYSRELFGWTHIGENFVEYAPTEIMSEDESDQDPPASGRKGNQPGEGKSNSGEEPKQSNPDSGSKTDTPPCRFNQSAAQPAGIPRGGAPTGGVDTSSQLRSRNFL